ncbi:MAG: hypothetical protein IAG10_08610 [Planctomycetaceae bacterium]|nr:hypothetical protein [Planctomycetaceae bacterium]
MTMHRAVLLLTVSWMLPLTEWAFTADPPNGSDLANVKAVSLDQADAPQAATLATGTKRAILLCGLSGDAPHHKLYSETVTKLHEGLSKRLGFADVHVLFGDEPQDADADVIKSAVRATRAELEKSVTTLGAKLQPDDALWVIVVGHSHYDGKFSWLNLPGPDIQQTEFAKLFADLTAREQVFCITTPTSGYYIKPLSAKGRIVITATETDFETNETEFPHELARVLSAPPEAKEFDIDEDGTISLFDLYVTVARNLAQSYLERELLATEHPLLDDNGDGRGTEVQIDFLTEEQGGRAKLRKPSNLPMNSTGDGRASKSITLSFSQAQAAQPTAEKSDQ